MKKSDIMGQCHIPEELLVKILCRLPRKSLCRFKCVSKQWCKLISNRNLIISKTTEVGLVFQCVRHYEANISSATFLRLDNRGGAYVDYSIYFNVRGYNMNEKYRICGSRNGFLLLLLNFRFPVHRPTHVVYNPITKFIEPVTPPDGIYQISRPGLVFDGNHLKMIFYTCGCDGLSFIFHVYSLEDKKWKKRELDNPDCHDLPIHSSSSTSKSLFFKGAMHWPFARHLLVYHLQNEFLKLIDLPSTFYCIEGCEHIFEFEGRLHYCKCSSSGRIKVWVLQMEEKNYAPRRQCFTWYCVHNDVLSPLNSVTKCRRYSPFAFNEDFGILYINCNDNVIISYNLETEKQELTYACPRSGEIEKSFEHVGFPFLYSSN